MERLWWLQVLRRHQGCWLQLGTVLTSQLIGLCSVGSQAHARVLSCFSRVQLFATVGAIARQTPLSMGFSRQEYQSGLPCPAPGESSWPRDRTHVSCIIQAGSLPRAPPGKSRQPGDAGVFQPWDATSSRRYFRKISLIVEWLGEGKVWQTNGVIRECRRLGNKDWNQKTQVKEERRRGATRKYFWKK